MLVGVVSAARIDPRHDHGRTLTDVYLQVVDEAVLAEELGFGAWRIGEHHFAGDQHNPGPFPLLAAVAARTSRIRIGSYVLLLALHDPLRVAEDAATIDVLSGGRLDLGVGVRAMAHEAAAFGVAPRDFHSRGYEALRVLELAFSGEPFSHQGRWFSYHDVQLSPRPCQPGGPPILVAAMGPQSLARAGRRGYHIASALHAPTLEPYLAAQAAAGRRREDFRLLSAPLAVHVAPTRTEAWDQAEAALVAFIDFYRSRGVDVVGRPLPEGGRIRDIPGLTMFGRPFAVGTPDEVMAVLSEHRDADLDELNLVFNHPGMEREHVRSSMTLFAERLLPELSGWGRR